MKAVPFYTYYVSHVLRQYFADRQPTNPTEAYRLNYECAKRVVEALPETEKNVLRDVYTPNTLTIAAKVNASASKHKLTPLAVWTMMSRVERRLAEERGLI